MEMNTDRLLVDELCAETERAWLDRGDTSVVDRLASEHPEHAAELYELFSALVFSAGDGSLPDGWDRLVTESTQSWLEAEGFELARQAARRAKAPRSFVKVLQEWTREAPDAIVRRIGDVSWEFLVMVSRFPELVPLRVREELAQRIARSWDIAPEACLRRLDASGPVPLAASRRDPYPPAPSSFDELLGRSSLSETDQAYWTSLAASHQPPASASRSRF